MCVVASVCVCQRGKESVLYGGDEFQVSELRSFTMNGFTKISKENTLIIHCLLCKLFFLKLFFSTVPV